MRDLVSIIIPVYNAEKFLEDTIKTIKDQTYDNWEAIFIDDASTDRSYEIIRKELTEKIYLMHLEKNQGPGMARNIGIDIAKGKYICFLDADDLWDNNKIERQIEFMEKNQYPFTYTSFRYMSENKTKIGKEVEIQKVLTYKNALKNTRILTITTMFDTTKISKELLKMPNTQAEDIITWWRILKNGYIAYGLQESLAFYRKVKNSRSYNKFELIKIRWSLYRKKEKLSFVKSLGYYASYLYYSIKKELIYKNKI